MRLDKHVQEWVTRTPGLVEALFDGLPDVMFYVKDIEGRYLWANQTLVDRAGLKALTSIVGQTADQLFPVAGSSTVAQDLEVIRTGRPIREMLRLYRTYRGDRFWCLSSKFPLLDEGWLVSRDTCHGRTSGIAATTAWRDSCHSSTTAWTRHSGSPRRPSMQRSRRTHWFDLCTRSSMSRPSSF